MLTSAAYKIAHAVVLTVAASLGLVASMHPSHAGAAPIDVDLELVLAVDTSASVDAVEYQLQMLGIAQALRDREIAEAIESLGGTGIAITLVHWSAEAAQAIAWTHVPDGASAARLAAVVEGTPRLRLGATTAIGSAIAFSSMLISSNEFAGRRRSIDVSGDGKTNSGLAIWGQRMQAVAAGITINGLAIVGDDPSLKTYYRDHVIAGPGAFAITATDFGDFARAFREKLLREIQVEVAVGPSRSNSASVALHSD